MKKLGENAHPFYFELPPHCPASVTLQPAPGEFMPVYARTLHLFTVLWNSIIFTIGEVAWSTNGVLDQGGREEGGISKKTVSPNPPDFLQVYNWS